MEVKVLPPDDAILTIRDVRRILGSGRDSTPRFPIWSKAPGTKTKITTGRALRLWLEDIVAAGGQAMVLSPDPSPDTLPARGPRRQGYTVHPRS